MDERQSQRIALMRTMADALRYPDFRHVFPATEPGEIPIIAALWDDPVSLFFEEVGKAGRPGYLVTREKDAELVIMSFRNSPNHAPMTDHSDDCPVHPDSEIGMLVEYILEVRGPVRCNLAFPDCEVTLVDDGDSKVPA
jgi:hypothetical protein